MPEQSQRFICEICGGAHPTSAHQKLPETERKEETKTISPELRKAILDYYTGSRFIKGAKATAEEIDDPLDRSNALSNIAIAEAKAGYFDQAKATAKEIERSYYRNSALSNIAIAEAKAGYFDQAKATAKEIERSYYRNSALINIAKAEAEAGYFDQAKATAEEIDDPDDCTEALSNIAKAEAEAGYFDQAKATAKEIDDPYYRTKALINIAKAEAKAGQDPRQSFQEAKATATEIDDPYSRVGALIDIAKAEAEAGYFDQAKATATEIDDPYSRVGALINIAKAEAKAGQDPRQSFQEAKATAKEIDDPYYRTKALINIAKAEAEAGYFDQAKTTATEIDDPYYRTKALSNIAIAEAKAGYFDQAKTTAKKIDYLGLRTKALSNIAIAEAKAGYFDQAKATAEEIDDPDDRTEALSNIAKAEAKAGYFDQAKATAEEIDDPDDRAKALINIAKAEAEAGYFDQAKATAKKIERSYYRNSALINIAIAEAKAGYFDQAKTTAKKIDYLGLRAKALRNIAKAEAEAGSCYIKDSRQVLQNFDPDAQSKALVIANKQNDQELIIALGALMSAQTQEKALGSLSPNDCAKARHLLDYGRTYALEVQESEEKEIHARTRKDLLKFLEGAVKEEPIAVSQREFKLITRILYNLDSDTARATLLEAARKASQGLENPLFARLLHTLIDADTPKGHDLAVKIIGDDRLPRHLAWLFTKKLVKIGYLDHQLINYLQDTRAKEKAKTLEEKLQLENQDLHLLRLIINRLGINPDVEVIKLIREKEWRDQEGNLINPRKNPAAIVYRIQEMRAKFEKIEDRDKLVSTLAQDKDKATTYYVLYGGKVHFALVNSYNSQKFYTILGIVDKLEYHPNPEQELQKALVRAGFQPDEAKEIILRLHKGAFPLAGERAWSVRLDVSDTAALEKIEHESRLLFGRSQLGALFKRIVYPELLAKVGDSSALQQLKTASGLIGLDAILGQIEEAHPEFLNEVERLFADAWKKIGAEQVLNLPLRNVLQEEENALDLIEMTKNLENHRKALAHTVRQQYKNKAIDKDTRDKYLQIIEHGSRAKLLRYMIETIVGGKGLSEEVEDLKEVEALFGEWQSHLEGIFQRFDELRAQTELRGIRKRKKIVTLRYLDKRDDLIPALRFADAAQCCFTSTHYLIEGYDVGHAQWIARLWKDPLSFIFMIENNPPQAEKREAIGFVFGSFGLNEEGEPVILLNGVYLQSGKTDLAVQSILKTIEDKLARPMKMREIYVATRHGGTARLSKDWSNEERTILRLRALAGPDGNPETKIYDDLNLMPNERHKTDKYVWHKRL